MHGRSETERIRQLETGQPMSELVDLWRTINLERIRGEDMKEYQQLFKFSEVKIVFESGVDTLDSMRGYVDDLLDDPDIVSDIVRFCDELADRVLSQAPIGSHRALEAEALKARVGEKLLEIRNSGRDKKDFVVVKSESENQIDQCLEVGNFDGAIGIWKHKGGNFSPVLLRGLIAYAIQNGLQSRLRQEKDYFCVKVGDRERSLIWNLEWNLTALTLTERGIFAMEEKEVLESLRKTNLLGCRFSDYVRLARQYSDKTSFVGAVRERLNNELELVRSGAKGTDSEVLELIEAILVWKGDLG